MPIVSRSPHVWLVPVSVDNVRVTIGRTAPPAKFTDEALARAWTRWVQWMHDVDEGEARAWMDELFFKQNHLFREA